ncbi:hypothetical protein [Spirosoma endbachense]|uniref:Uncharacterized protein n=1 Tax=Spirosoma endbachense TaxID=2666025 RepID=A0A6P1VYM2_9BACT|nr:hypothetical protein [Spirosoma endbachense]QHV96857.1 hypothetical protein GJR95_18395 [Spirosoma endbachense]
MNDEFGRIATANPARCGGFKKPTLHHYYDKAEMASREVISQSRDLVIFEILCSTNRLN